MDPTEDQTGLYQNKGARRSHRLKNKQINYRIPEENEIFTNAKNKNTGASIVKNASNINNASIRNNAQNHKK